MEDGFLAFGIVVAKLGVAPSIQTRFGAMSLKLLYACLPFSVGGYRPPDGVLIEHMSAVRDWLAHQHAQVIRLQSSIARAGCDGFRLRQNAAAIVANENDFSLGDDDRTVIAEGSTPTVVLVIFLCVDGEFVDAGCPSSLIG